MMGLRAACVLLTTATATATALPVGCGACEGNLPASIRVTVQDAETAEPVCDAKVTVRGEGVAITLSSVACRYNFFREVPGAYEVEVLRQGYQPRRMEARLVTKDANCGRVFVVPLAFDLPRDQSVRVLADAGHDGSPF